MRAKRGRMRRLESPEHTAPREGAHYSQRRSTLLPEKEEEEIARAPDVNQLLELPMPPSKTQE